VSARVTVYTRSGCGLCRMAERLVADEAAGHALQLVDIDADPELQRRYNIRVPVIAIDGTETLEGRLVPGQVRRALRDAGHGGGWLARLRRR
jgi:glutaredoxin